MPPEDEDLGDLVVGGAGADLGVETDGRDSANGEGSQPDGVTSEYPDSNGKVTDDDSGDVQEPADGRSWKNVALEERRKREASERKIDDLVARVLQNTPQQAAPAAPKRPYSEVEIRAFGDAGDTASALAALEANHQYDLAVLKKEIRSEVQRDTQVDKLDRLLRSKLSPGKNERYDRALAATVAKLEQEFPFLAAEQRTLLASSILGVNAYSSKNGSVDSRLDSRHRQRDKNGSARDRDTRPRYDRSDPASKLTAAHKQTLSNMGMTHLLTPDKDPAKEKRRIERLTGLVERLGAAEGEDE